MFLTNGMTARDMDKTYLFSIDNIHNHATLEHAGQTSLDGKRRSTAVTIGLCVMGTVGGGQ